MARYRLYFLQQDALPGLDEVEARDDSEAVALVKERADGATVEIWCGERRVRTIAARHLSEALPG